MHTKLFLLAGLALVQGRPQSVSNDYSDDDAILALRDNLDLEDYTQMLMSREAEAVFDMDDDVFDDLVSRGLDMDIDDPLSLLIARTHPSEAASGGAGSPPPPPPGRDWQKTLAPLVPLAKAVAPFSQFPIEKKRFGVPQALISKGAQLVLGSQAPPPPRLPFKISADVGPSRPAPPQRLTDGPTKSMYTEMERQRKKDAERKELMDIAMKKAAHDRAQNGRARKRAIEDLLFEEQFEY